MVSVGIGLNNRELLGLFNNRTFYVRTYFVASSDQSFEPRTVGKILSVDRAFLEKKVFFISHQMGNFIVR